MKRKKIFSDYAQRLDEDGKITYEYGGPAFTLDLTPAQRRRYLAACWACPLIGLALFVAMGLAGGDGSYQMYVMLPYVCLLLPWCMLLGDAYKLTRATGTMRRAEYERSVAQVRRFAIAGIALSAVTAVAQIVYLCLSRTETPGADTLFLVGACLQICLFRMMHILYGRINSRVSH